MMKWLWWTKVTTQWSFWILLVSLHYFTKDVELLLSNVDRLIDDDPGYSLVTSRHRYGTLVRHIMIRVGQKTLQR